MFTDQPLLQDMLRFVSGVQQQQQDATQPVQEQSAAPVEHAIGADRGTVQARLLAESRLRLIASIKRHFHRKYQDGLLSSRVGVMKDDWEDTAGSVLCCKPFLTQRACLAAPMIPNCSAMPVLTIVIASKQLVQNRNCRKCIAP